MTPRIGDTYESTPGRRWIITHEYRRGIWRLVNTNDDRKILRPTEALTGPLWRKVKP